MTAALHYICCYTLELYDSCRNDVEPVVYHVAPLESHEQLQFAAIDAGVSPGGSYHRRSSGFWVFLHVRAASVHKRHVVLCGL